MQHQNTETVTSAQQRSMTPLQPVTHTSEVTAAPQFKRLNTLRQQLLQQWYESGHVNPQLALEIKSITDLHTEAEQLHDLEQLLGYLPEYV
jgi:hypothetical protein